MLCMVRGGGGVETRQSGLVERLEFGGSGLQIQGLGIEGLPDDNGASLFRRRSWIRIARIRTKSSLLAISINRIIENTIQLNELDRPALSHSGRKKKVMKQYVKTPFSPGMYYRPQCKHAFAQRHQQNKIGTKQRSPKP